ncbi:DUF4097 family beta strand repeat-containing protein [Saccharopolyspora sp. 6V]|uniref:DUF4097 family beta strand repeat-containing protein n=1 Tax=Saccharopolyspora sp. 6V TaxID=2877239 RepID=UPI001CD29E2F|nr:DUF4097 family beta strand repeat-containing protein [Saccharopolyspora sp. 6V]MCA1194175.1 DUF4097 domain-containing protein [Saccharopolyspora sp. 6V]
MSRTITHHLHSGPGRLRLRLPAGRIRVTAVPGVEHAEVRLTAQDPSDTYAVEAIQQTAVSQLGDLLSVTVPVTDAPPRTVVHRSGTSVFTAGSTHVVIGSSSGITISGGTVITGGGTVVTGAGGGGIIAEVTVPGGQQVELDAASAEISTSGPLTLLRATTGSGSVRIGEATVATVKTGSGDIVADRTGELDARTGSGDITVRAATRTTSLRTGSGDVRVHLADHAPLRVRTGSGDITATAAPGIHLDRSGLRTGSGDITTR